MVKTQESGGGGAGVVVAGDGGTVGELVLVHLLDHRLPQPHARVDEPVGYLLINHHHPSRAAG